MKRALALCATLVLVVLAVALFRAIAVRSHQVSVSPASEPVFDRSAVAAHLAGAIRIPTISREGAKPDDAVFNQFAAYLAETYPLVHQRLRRETIADHSLLYTWPGSDRSLDPVLLAAHQDVVPVDDATIGKWTHPPFDAVMEGGYLWGRGALDDKAALISILEAAERLLANGFTPRRTIYLAFGHDEEVSGLQGAMKIAAVLKQRGIHLLYALDEGGMVTTGIVPGISGPVAVVGVSEKGYMDVELKVAGTGGHSSAPPEHTAVGVLAQAINALERQPFPVEIRPPQDRFFEYAAPEMGFPLRFALTNLWLMRPLVLRTMSRTPLTLASLHTTIAVTFVQGSPKYNVLPTEARAVVNLRLMPGDRVDYVLDYLRRAIDDPTVQIRALDGYEASPVSDLGAPAGVAVQRAIREVYPEAIAAPMLMTGATDVRHYAPIAGNAYRFSAISAGPDVTLRAHGIDERVTLSDLDKAPRFYARLLLGTAAR